MEICAHFLPFSPGVPVKLIKFWDCAAWKVNNGLWTEEQDTVNRQYNVKMLQTLNRWNNCQTLFSTVVLLSSQRHYAPFCETWSECYCCVLWMKGLNVSYWPVSLELIVELNLMLFWYVLFLQTAIDSAISMNDPAVLVDVLNILNIKTLVIFLNLTPLLPPLFVWQSLS